MDPRRKVPGLSRSGFLTASAAAAAGLGRPGSRPRAPRRPASHPGDRHNGLGTPTAAGGDGGVEQGLIPNASTQSRLILGSSRWRAEPAGS
jgi:hypothetical protein